MGIFASECPENLDEITRVKKYTCQQQNNTVLKVKTSFTQSQVGCTTEEWFYPQWLLLERHFCPLSLRDSFTECWNRYLNLEKALGEFEEKQIVNSRVQELVNNLKETVYDVEDLFDDMGIEGSVQELEDFNVRLENIVKKLDMIVDEVKILNLNGGVTYGKSISRLPTTSLLDKSDICFRNDDKMQLLDILLSDDSNSKGLPVIAIVEEEFDVSKITKSIYEAFTLEQTDDLDLNVLQVKLQWKLMAKKFLIVLDNIWNEKSREWDLLRLPLQVGAPRSKIIVTTRSQNVSSTVHGVHVHDLKMLLEKDCWSLFAKHAFEDKNPDEYPNLKRIGHEIVRKCNGLPLAITTYARLLRSEEDAEEWNYHEQSGFVMHDFFNDLAQHIAGEFCFKFEDGSPLQNLGRVRHLSFKLRPKDKWNKFAALSEKNKVLRTFLPLPCTKKNAIFSSQDFTDLFPAKNCLRVLSLSGYEVSVLPDSICDSKQLRYFDLSNTRIESLPERVGKLCNLETLKLFNCTFLCHLPANLSNLTKLELLDISGTHIKELLDSIGELKQLSYFDLSRTLIQCLPRGVCSLGNLWTLKLAHCPNLTHLPEDMSGLTKLKHLDIKETPLKELPYSIGQLENLSYLDVSGTDIQCLPDGVCFLENLQTLKLSNCPRLIEKGTIR
ncbi:hypothetical protein V6N13_004453 [Hibiscus sabdariffa]